MSQKQGVATVAIVVVVLATVTATPQVTGRWVLTALPIVVALLFLVGGIQEQYKVEVDLVPILLIVAGVALLISIFGRRRQPSQSRPRPSMGGTFVPSGTGTDGSSA